VGCLLQRLARDAGSVRSFGVGRGQLVGMQRLLLDEPERGA